MVTKLGGEWTTRGNQCYDNESRGAGGGGSANSLRKHDKYGIILMKTETERMAGKRTGSKDKQRNANVL